MSPAHQSVNTALHADSELTSALIPWHPSGACKSATLGVASCHYAPRAFSNLACSLLASLHGYSRFARKPVEGGPTTVATGETT